MGRRRFLTGLGALGAIGAVATVVAFGGRGDDQRAAAADGRSTTTPAATTVKVTTRDLVQTTDFDGTLGFGETRDLIVGAGGIVTAVVPAGTVVDRGGDLVEIDGKTVVLLIGDRPMWRMLGDGVSDGPDVQQLEENLIALGFATADDLGPNQKWTWTTTVAVKKWQKARGVEQTGVVDRSQVVFEPGARTHRAEHRCRRRAGRRADRQDHRRDQGSQRRPVREETIVGESRRQGANRSARRHHPARHDRVDRNGGDGPEPRWPTRGRDDPGDGGVRRSQQRAEARPGSGEGAGDDQRGAVSWRCRSARCWPAAAVDTSSND